LSPELIITDWSIVPDKISFFSYANGLITATLVGMNVSSPISADTWHLMVVVKALAEVAGLTNVDSFPSSWFRFFGEDVVGWRRRKCGADVINLIRIGSTGLSRPLAGSFSHKVLLQGELTFQLYCVKSTDTTL